MTILKSCIWPTDKKHLYSHSLRELRVNCLDLGYFNGKKKLINVPLFAYDDAYDMISKAMFTTKM